MKNCEAYIYIKQGRHPVLDSCLPENKQYVPNDTHMNVSESRDCFFFSLFVTTVVKLNVTRLPQVRKRSRGGAQGGGGGFLVREFSFESGKIDVLRENRGKLKL